MEQREDIFQHKSIIIETDDVIKEMKKIASANNLKLSELSFKLLKVTTHFDDEKVESVQWGKDEMMRFWDEPFMLNPNLKIKQYYSVEIFKLSPNANRDTTLPSITLSANKNLTKVVAIVAKSNDMRYHPMLESLIIEAIQTTKIRSGILIGFRDRLMYKEIEKLVAYIRVNGIIDQERRFVVSEGIADIPSVDDSMIYHYKKKAMLKNAEGKIDYSKRGYVAGVEKDECIMEYTKPQRGMPGRNCKGIFIPIKEPQTTNAIPMTITPNISKEVTDTSIKYIANRGGYVSAYDGRYDIQDQMEIDEISFRATGSIDSKMTSDIKINIKEKDTLKDAIGPGMSVETSELKVQGNVGSGAKIKAKWVEIGGQTHQSSFINADTIAIAVHRGEASGKAIRIERLEGGKVFGEDVYVGQMIGGEVIATRIKIGILMSNAKLFASERIEIQETRGSHNKLVIDTSVTKELSKNIEDINHAIVKNEQSLKAYERQLHTKKHFIDKNKPMADVVKCKILELMQNNVKPPSTLFAKLKDFQKKVVEYNTLLECFKETKESLDTLHQELVSVQTRIFSAKIINHSPWSECNLVSFHLLVPPQEITYRPKEGEMTQELLLKAHDNGEHRIVSSRECFSS